MQPDEIEAIRAVVEESHRIPVEIVTGQEAYQVTLVSDNINVSFEANYVVVDDEGKLHEDGDFVADEFELEELLVDEDGGVFVIPYVSVDRAREPEFVDNRGVVDQ